MTDLRRRLLFEVWAPGCELPLGPVAAEPAFPQGALTGPPGAVSSPISSPVPSGWRAHPSTGILPNTLDLFCGHRKLGAGPGRSGPRPLRAGARPACGRRLWCGPRAPWSGPALPRAAALAGGTWACVGGSASPSSWITDRVSRWGLPVCAPPLGGTAGVSARRESNPCSCRSTRVNGGAGVLLGGHTDTPGRAGPSGQMTGTLGGPPEGRGCVSPRAEQADGGGGGWGDR